MIVIALLAGVLSQIIAVYLGIPSIVFLLLFGVLLGPDVLNFVDPLAYGQGFEVLIKLFVALILFEAGLNLDIDEIKSHTKVILPLLTIGAIVTMIGGAFFAWFISDFNWSLAFLFGSIVIVTGPTVIQPLLRRIHVKTNLKNILEFEGTFIDPIGAIIAIFVFELVLQSDQSVFLGINYVVLRFAVGLGVGLVGGYLTSYLINKWSIHLDENQDFFVIALALGIYTLSESILSESGLMAAVASGIVVGNTDIPNKQNLKKFKGKISLLVISLLFVLLAASLELEYIYGLGYNGILIVVALMFVVRPLNIFISSINSDLKFREKIFLSFISPRGIVAASIASLIGIELKKRGVPGGETLQGLVFLTIALTVIFQGLTAKKVADLLGLTVEKSSVVIVGANAFARLIGRLLTKENIDVSLIDTNDRLVQMALQEGLNAVEGNSLDISQLEETGIDSAYKIVSITSSDKLNLLVCRLAKVDFDVKEAMPLVNKRVEAMDLESVSKLNLNMAFGKPLNLFDINTKLSDKDYVVVSVKINRDTDTERLRNIFSSDHIIPLFYKNDRGNNVQLYNNETKFNNSGEITLIDFDPTLTDLSFIETDEKTIIEI